MLSSYLLLQKLTFDNNVKCIPSTKSSPSENAHEHKPKTAAFPTKKAKNFHEIIKTPLKVIQQEKIQKP